MVPSLSAKGNANEHKLGVKDQTNNKQGNEKCADLPVNVELAEVLHRGLELEFVHDLVDHLQHRPDAKPREGGCVCV